VIVPINYLPSTFPTAHIVPVPSSPTFGIISTARVPSSIPSTVITAVPTVPVISTLPSPPNVLPSTPVYIPTYYLPSTIASTNIVTVPGHPTIVIVPQTLVPEVPSTVVIPVPTKVPSTVINRCVSIISHYSFPQPPSSLAFLE
jgi:hypothetical protein